MLYSKILENYNTHKQVLCAQPFGHMEVFKLRLLVGNSTLHSAPQEQL